VPYVIENKSSYLKPGAAITKTHKEDALFDNMFEIVLKEDYEDHFMFREMEKQGIDEKNRLAFMKQMNRKVRGSRRSFKQGPVKVTIDLLHGTSSKTLVTKRPQIHNLLTDRPSSSKPKEKSRNSTAMARVYSASLIRPSDHSKLLKVPNFDLD
jgi:hypothetical protein